MKNWKALSALRDSLCKIISDANKMKQLADVETKPNLFYKQQIKELNNNIEMWKYDNLKTMYKNDKSNLEPIKLIFFFHLLQERICFKFSIYFIFLTYLKRT